MGAAVVTKDLEMIDYVIAHDLLKAVNGKENRTMSMVSARRGIPKSTLNGRIGKLCGLGYLKKDHKKGCREQFYQPGPKTPFITSRMKGNFLTDVIIWVYNQKTGGGHTTRNTESKIPEQDLLWEIHLASIQLQFRIEEGGYLEKAMSKNAQEKSQTTVLYFNQYNLKGSQCWNAKILLRGDEYSVKYQETRLARYLFVSPPKESVIMGEDANNKELAIQRLEESVWPLLQIYEKYEGWIIERDEKGYYLNRAEIKESHIHRAMRGSHNKEITDLTGPFGISGKDVWVDGSPGHLEFETNRPDHIDSIRVLPMTTQMTWKNNRRENEIEERVDRLEERVDNIEKPYKMERESKVDGKNELTIGEAISIVLSKEEFKKYSIQKKEPKSG